MSFRVPTMPPCSVASDLSNGPSQNHTHEKEHQEYYEEDLRHIRCGSGDAAKSKHAGNDCYYETHNCPIKHIPFLRIVGPTEHGNALHGARHVPVRIQSESVSPNHFPKPHRHTGFRDACGRTRYLAQGFDEVPFLLEREQIARIFVEHHDFRRFPNGPGLAGPLRVAARPTRRPRNRRDRDVNMTRDFVLARTEAI